MDFRAGADDISREEKAAAAPADSSSDGSPKPPVAGLQLSPSMQQLVLRRQESYEPVLSARGVRRRDFWRFVKVASFLLPSVLCLIWLIPYTADSPQNFILLRLLFLGLVCGLAMAAVIHKWLVLNFLPCAIVLGTFYAVGMAAMSVIMLLYGRFTMWFVGLSLFITHFTATLLMAAGVAILAPQRRSPLVDENAPKQVVEAARRLVNMTPVDWPEIFTINGAVFALFAQLSFSLGFGFLMLNIVKAAWVKVLMCSSYPFAILIFKVVQRVLLRNAPVLHRDAEFASLMLGGMPYRVIFLVLSEWGVFAAILVVETVFKIIVYPVKISSTANKAKKAVAKATANKISVKMIDELIMQGEEETEHVDYKLSVQFFFHSLVDTLSVVGVLFVFAYLRFYRHTFPTSLMSEKEWDFLCLQYGLMVVYEVILVFGTIGVVYKFMERTDFRPWHRGTRVLDNDFAVMYTFTMVVYFAVFLLMDFESIPFPFR